MKIFQIKLIVFILLLTFIQTTVFARDARKTYFEANAAYSELSKSDVKRKYRINWLNVIKKFQSVYLQDPDGPWAPAGLFMTGVLYKNLYGYSGRESDIIESIDNFERLLNRYPDSAYAIKSKNHLDELNPSQKRAVTRKKHQVIQEIRHWSNPKYTRIVLDLSGSVKFTHNKLHNPERIFIDLRNCKLGDIPRFLKINDDLLKDARASQNRPDIVRVVFDIKSKNQYKVFSLKNPFRVVIDVEETPGAIVAAANDETLPKIKVGKSKNIAAGAITKQFALGVKNIVIDPGHGGKDTGAPGYHRGVYEKDIVLAIAKKLAAKIKSKLNCNVYLTRSNDKFISLEERTAIANTKNADLFISIHTNASRNRRASGIETYFLNLATDNASISVAARENATSKKNISDLQSILNDLMQNAKINESSLLARYVHKYLFSHMKSKYSKVKNKGVKQAPFYVLLGAQMPSILVEVSFISNKRECSRLRNNNYQNHLSDGIANGVKEYIKRITK